MVVCVASFIVFGFLSIFSVKYRPLAKEAFECMFKLISLKPCDSGLDQKVKARVTSKLLGRSSGLAKFIHGNFKILSLIFVILFVGSMLYTGYGVFNLAVYGSCDPHGECVFTSDDGCGGSSCEDECLCEDVVCESPEYKACEGNCDCEESVCG